MRDYSYRGCLQGVVLDWSGTTVDYGCIAPAQVFVEVFSARGVPVTLDEARSPMGMTKRDHIRAVLHLPRVAEVWQTVHGQAPDEAVLDALYADFVPRQMQTIIQYSDLIPGVVETIAALRVRDLKIGSCTGYSRAMMDALAPIAARAGYVADCIITPDDVPYGRPTPFMIYANALRLGIYPLQAIVKVGDTVVDIEEGRNAGCWTVGLALTGNEIGLSQAEWAALPPREARARLEAARHRLHEAGAHYVIDSLSDVLPVIDAINARLSDGERP
ncbi:MAG: phosphonoacetaldehyde hydrolase [Anaerolineae bacterium]|nr:phosphonoacetaldehyde hydrolase [Anaerolineae bacterium]MDW8171971.1 phosphonoacetaldehyde hydrolase [Anaerolineae bacterium]